MELNDLIFPAPYAVKDGCLGYMKSEKGGEPYFVKLCNFVPFIASQLIVDDGAETKVRVEIGGFDFRGRALQTITVPDEKFNSLDWVRNNWGYEFNLETGQTVKDRIRYFLQSTAEHAEKKKVYAATGWKCINGRWGFLMPGDEQHTVCLEGRCGVYGFVRDNNPDAAIKSFGVIEPIIVLEPDRYKGGNYEIISGRRRNEACKELGIIDIPTRVLRMPADDAMIALIDMNLCQRTDIPPSEKGAAYKLRLEAMKRQGYRTDLEEDATSAQPGQKSGVTSIEQLASESPDSKSQIKRYIRITELEPELQKMVDEKRIALTPAVELSYLPKEAQRDLVTTIESEEATPSLSQAQQMRKLSESGALDMDRIFSIMTQLKPNQKETIKVPVEYVRQFRPKDSISQLQKFIQDACAHYAKYLRNRDRGAR